MIIDNNDYNRVSNNDYYDNDYVGFVKSAERA